MSTPFPIPLTQQQSLDYSEASEVLCWDTEGRACFQRLQGQVELERHDSLKAAPEASCQPHPGPGPVGPF